MRWEDERYVRLYTRDSVDWHFLSLEAQGLFCLLLRKADRAGIIRFGRHGVEGLARMIGHQGRIDVIAAALDELARDGCVQMGDDALVFPNFIEAQEAKSSDAQRKRDQRERERDKALAEAEPVTPRHKKSQAVTGGHTESQAVTPSRAVPSRTEPAEPPEPSKKEAHSEKEIDPHGQIAAPAKPTGTQQAFISAEGDDLVALVDDLFRAATGEEFPWGWPGGAEEKALRELATVHGEKLPALLRTAFDPSEFPRIGSLTQVQKKLGDLRQKAATLKAKAGTGPPGREVGRRRVSAGACVIHGPTDDVGEIWGHQLCAPCRGDWIQSQGPTNEDEMRLWVEARKGNAA